MRHLLNVVVPQPIFSFPITLEQYNHMATYYIGKYSQSREFAKKGKSNGNKLYSENINFRFHADTKNSKEIN